MPLDTENEARSTQQSDADSRKPTPDPGDPLAEEIKTYLVTKQEKGKLHPQLGGQPRSPC